MNGCNNADMTFHAHMAEHLKSRPRNGSSIIHVNSGGEQSLGETKYIIGNSYTVGKVWASTFGIN